MNCRLVSACIVAVVAASTMLGFSRLHALGRDHLFKLVVDIRAWDRLHGRLLLLLVGIPIVFPLLFDRVAARTILLLLLSIEHGGVGARIRHEVGFIHSTPSFRYMLQLSSPSFTSGTRHDRRAAVGVTESRLLVRRAEGGGSGGRSAVERGGRRICTADLRRDELLRLLLLLLCRFSLLLPHGRSED